MHCSSLRRLLYQLISNRNFDGSGGGEKEGRQGK